MADDDVKGIAKYLYALGFPIGLIALVGAFAMGLAIFQGEISLGSKRFLLGAFLLSFAISAWHLPNILYRGLYDGTKWRWSFSLSALIWTVAFGAAAYRFGHLLYPLINQ